MAVKKKAASAKIANESQSILRDGIMARPNSGTPTRGDSARSESEKQLQAFDKAMQLFRKQQFGEAKIAFAEATTGPQREITHIAKTHILMCDRRLDQPVVSLNTLDDHYNYAIERLNARDMDKARKHLDCAMQLVRKNKDNTPDHLYYAMALCAGISGDTDAAFENLKRAIELNPKIRMTARQDTDLAPVAQQPQIQQLLYPDKQAGPF